MPLTPAECRARFASARVARLATVRGDGAPHLVPMTFAVLTTPSGEDAVWHVVDGKPKSTRALRRLDHIAAEPRVSLLVDHYADDWSQLWWARADGVADIVDVTDPRGAEALSALIERYADYAAEPPAGPLVRVRVERWTGWAAQP